MKTTLPALAALTLAASPAAAQDSPEEQRAQVTAAVDAFMAAIASEDKTELAAHMVPEAMIFIHNRMDPANPRVDRVSVAGHLERWAGLTSDYEETMRHDSVLVDGDMAQVWGPYSFTANGRLTHCGVNSITMVRGEDGRWRVGNTSFSMVPPGDCASVGADWVAAQ